MYGTTGADICPLFCYTDFVLFFLFSLASSSGALFAVQFLQWHIAILVFLLIMLFIYVPIEYLILSFISSKNQKFLKNHSEKIPQNKNFIIFFIFWRIFLPDIFVASSLAARYFRMNLSKKHIFLLSLLVQVIRMSLLAMIYFIFI